MRPTVSYGGGGEAMVDAIDATHVTTSVDLAEEASKTIMVLRDAIYPISMR